MPSTVEAPLRVLVADDEALARRRLLRLLQAIPGVESVGECTDGAEVLDRIREGGVDVVLLDIHMPNLTGLDAMELMPLDGPYVIFCTAHPDHAVKAFDAGAVDYLLKPIEAARLHKAIERARSRDAVRRFQSELRQHRAEPPRKLQRLPVSTRQGIVLLDPEEISHAIIEGELVRIFAGQGELLTDATLQEIQDKLPSDRFMRVHRRALANLERIARLEPLETGGYLARTQKGHSIEVSRQSARELRRSLGLRKPGTEEAE
jgi:two-component system LytT family response regulator